MDPEQYAQEMMCSFEASVRGAIYAREIEAMELDGRIGDYPAQKGIPVNVVADLGWRDLTTIGFYQERPDGIVVDRAIGDNMKPINHYIKQIKDYFRETGHRLGQIYLPHDARAKSLQTGKSTVEQFMTADLRPRIVTELSLMDGISATRKMMPHLYYNKAGTKDLVLAMKSYHRKYDEDRKVYTDEPVHDWSSHWTDMQRYMAIMANRRLVDGPPRSGIKAGIVPSATQGLQYGFALDDIWDLTPNTNRRR